MHLATINCKQNNTKKNIKITSFINNLRLTLGMLYNSIIIEFK